MINIIVPRSTSGCVDRADRLCAERKRVNSSRGALVHLDLLVKFRGDETTFRMEEKKFGHDGALADVTHSLLRRVIAVIAGHARRSRILTRGLHALGYLLKAILPHLNPLGHVAHRGVFCEEEESTGMKTRNHSMPRHVCHCKTRAESPVFTGPTSIRRESHSCLRSRYLCRAHVQMKESHFPGNPAMQSTAMAKYLGVVSNGVLAIAVMKTQQYVYVCVCVQSAQQCVLADRLDKTAGLSPH